MIFGEHISDRDLVLSRINVGFSVCVYLRVLASSGIRRGSLRVCSTVLHHKGRSHLDGGGIEPSQMCELDGNLIRVEPFSRLRSRFQSCLRTSSPCLCESMITVRPAQVPTSLQAIIRQFSHKETLIRQNKDEGNNYSNYVIY